VLPQISCVEKRGNRDARRHQVSARCDDLAFAGLTQPRYNPQGVPALRSGRRVALTKEDELPRRPEHSNSSDRGGERRQRDGSAPRREPRRDTDENALALREENHSYASVARSLGFKRADDARKGFLRAFAKRQGVERDALRLRELGRLDVLEARIRSRDAHDPEKMAGRLIALDVLRGELPEQ